MSSLATLDEDRLQRLLARPVFVVGFWWRDDDSNGPPSETLVAHGTADALSSWLARHAPEERQAIRRLRNIADGDDRRWEDDGEPAVAFLRQRRSMGSPQDPWISVAVIDEL